MTSDNKTDILITKFFSGEALPEEAMELEDWVQLSPENESYFNRCSKIFAMTIDITYSDNKHPVWENIKNAIYAKKNKSKARLVNWRLTGIAASVILIIATTLFINNYFKKENDIVVYQSAASPKKILLKDNSEINLLPNSSVIINKKYGITSRKIKLTGSASFSVIHNPSQAFIIDVNKLHIKDIGTAFSVITSSTNDTIFIHVTEGEISVYDDFGSLQNVGAGEKVIYIQSQKKLQFFHIKQDGVTATKPNERNVETKNTDTSKNIHSMSTPKDSSVHNYYPYSSYPSQYPLNEGYTPEGKRALMYKDSVETKKIRDDMLKGKLITSEQLLSFRLSNTEFIINGKLQSDAIFQRYRKKYIPVPEQGKEWVWSHNMGEQDHK